MGRCSSCGFDLPGHEKLCNKCYVARYGALAAPQDSFRQSWTTYLYLLLWIFVSYVFVTYMPAPATVGVLLVGLVVVLYLFWGLTRKNQGRDIEHRRKPCAWFLASAVALCGR